MDNRKFVILIFCCLVGSTSKEWARAEARDRRSDDQDTLQVMISNLAKRIDVLEAENTELKHKVELLQAHQSDVTSLQSQISSLQSTEIGLQTQVTGLQAKDNEILNQIAQGQDRRCETGQESFVTERQAENQTHYVSFAHPFPSPPYLLTAFSQMSSSLRSGGVFSSSVSVVAVSALTADLSKTGFNLTLDGHHYTGQQTNVDWIACTK